MSEDEQLAALRDRINRAAPDVLLAEDLTKAHLGRLITVVNWRKERVSGRLDGYSLHRDPQMRMSIRVATLEHTESGGFYWSTFLNEQAVDRTSTVTVAEAAPDF